MSSKGKVLMFQWGHGYSAMDRENKIEIPDWLWEAKFQWGHGYSAMDRRPQ